MRNLKYTCTDDSVFDNIEEAEQHQQNLDDDLKYEINQVITDLISESSRNIENGEEIISNDITDYIIENFELK